MGVNGGLKDVFIRNVYFINFSKKTLNTYLKLEIRVVSREFLAFKYVFIIFFKSNQMIIYICTSDILNSRLYRILVTQYPFIFVWAGRVY